MLHELAVRLELCRLAYGCGDDSRLGAQRLAEEERPFAARQLKAASDNESRREAQRLAVEEQAGMNYKAADDGKWLSPPRTASPEAVSS